MEKLHAVIAGSLLVQAAAYEVIRRAERRRKARAQAMAEEAQTVNHPHHEEIQ